MDRKRPRSRLSLGLLQGFDAAARQLSFTRAAQDLHLTQSAISREIKTLEGQLGQPLFIRVHRGLRLTYAGQTLSRAVSEALALIDEATSHLTHAKKPELLTITTSAPLASTWLVPKLRGFISLHPEVDVRCVAADQKLDLERERLDIAIRWAASDSAVLGGQPLFDVCIFPVCAPALARDSARPLRNPADLGRHVLLDLDTVTGSGSWSDWAPWLQAAKLRDLKPVGTLRFSHYDQVVHAAIDGSGVAIGRTPHTARHLNDGVLIAPFGDTARYSFGKYVSLVAPRSAERPVVKAFLAWLHEEIRKDTKMEGAPRQPRPFKRGVRRLQPGKKRLSKKRRGD